MKKVNVRNIPEELWTSPKGTFAAAGKGVSIALGRDSSSTDLMKRQPFDVEILRVLPGKKAYPYHSHGAQWEFYHVISGRGKMRHAEGIAEIEEGDAIIFKPGEAHQIINDSGGDLVLYVIADNPISESVHYPDRERWMVYSPERRLMQPSGDDYYEGHE
jgi:uncharacterized cupin superfamily protein